MRIAFVLLFIPLSLAAQEGRLIPNPIRDIPRWARDEFQRTMADKYAITYSLFPHTLLGDFDGDGKKDVVIQVVEKRSKMAGFMIIHARKPQALFIGKTIVGAGRSIGTSGDDLSWVNEWSVVSAKRLAAADYGSIIDAKGDALIFAKRGAQKFLLYWNGKRYEWHRVGK
ncbi:MAG TPA: hypothetical protein VLY03_02725 [Bacteroidota bacterium]|nr:hypothetical protein [Bacteroidota bacterium]